MEAKTVFLSSCSRRELARRRPSRTFRRLQTLTPALLVIAALVTMIAVRGL